MKTTIVVSKKTAKLMRMLCVLNECNNDELINRRFKKDFNLLREKIDEDLGELREIDGEETVRA